MSSSGTQPADKAQASASDRYDIALAMAKRSVAVSIGQDHGRRTRVFPIPSTTSRSDKAMLIGALAQTCLSVADKEAENQWLKEQLAVATQQLYGTASEKKPRSPEPPKLEEATGLPTGDASVHNPVDCPAASAAETSADDQNIVPITAGRKALAPHLPRTRQEHPLPSDTCLQCQGSLRALPPEITEQMIVMPARYEVVRHIRHKAVCRCCATFVAAPRPASMVEGSSYGSASFLAYIACNKYQLGLPYYRQEKLFEQSHVPLNRTTMANLMNTGADRCVGLFALLKDELLSQAVAHADETTLQVLKEPHRAAQTTSYMWLYCSAVHAARPVILFDYQETRAGKHAQTFLHGFTGYLHTDGYAGYGLLEGVTRVGCMAHMRRGFVKARDLIPKELRANATAAWPIDQIGILYTIEKKYADATPQQRQQARQQFSLPVMNAIKAWLDRQAPRILPQSLLGKAIGYALNQWDRLMVYLVDGRLAIDNNLAERAIKDLVLGRKAWLFADRPEGAHTIAIMHSLVQTAVANGLDPYRYLVHVFEIMPTLKTGEELQQLLPWNVVLPDKLGSLPLAA